MDKKEIGAQIDVLVSEMEKTTITTDEQYEFLADWLKRNKKTQAIIAEVFEPERKKTYDAYQAVMEEKKTMLSRLEKTEGIAKKKMAAWYDEKEKKRIEDQRKADEAARLAAEEQKLEQAVELDELGLSAAAEEVLAAPAPAVKAVEVKNEAKVSGVVYVKKWSAEVVDIKALARAVADGKVPATLIAANMSALNDIASSLKEYFDIPGCRATSETTVRAGR